MLKHIVNVARAFIHETGKKVARSGRWPAVERAKRKAQPTCEACGGTTRLQVHHVAPFHLHPELELEPTNLIVLCMGPAEDHLLIGHGDSFQHYCPDVRQLAAKSLADPSARTALAAHAKASRLVG